MEAWQEKRSVHTMNLRSVFTAEQQRILERYYNNGMTNQSKSCFQLILQCAQEAKLDFSVVRTWVGNKRRKLASKVDKNGVMGLSSHTIVGTSGALMTSPVLTEMGAIRGIQHGPPMTHLLPPPASCPSSSSSSSSSTSSSPSSNGANNNNNDVIVTGAYSVARGNTRPDASSQSRVAAKAVPVTPNPESSVHSRLVVHPELVSLQRKSPQVPTSGIQLFNQMRRTISPQDLSTVPPSWAKQYGAPQHPPWPTTSQPPASTNLHRTPPASPAESGVRIKQVFTIAGLANSSPGPSPTTGQAHGPKKSQPTDPLQTFSIAMETGDADEYSREEELANMGAQMHLDKSAGGSAGSEMSSEASSHDSQGMYTVMAEAQTAGGLKNTLNSALAGEKGCQTNSALLFGSASCGSYSVRQFSENSLPRMPNHKVNILSAPWLLSNSRKRTLQDRTQFSDGDLYALKRYWDNGMTSLGSVCREKISAAATELNVDSEIVKTWIGNRRRKYRLMGIEIPPPKGGPATFTKVTNADHSPSTTPENGSKSTRLEHDGETNDTGSICLSEGEPSDPYMKNNDDGNEMSSSVLDENVKIEIIDEDDDDDDGDLMATDMEEMHNLLEYKHEEVQYLESELENQKLRYQELRAFTKSLLSALKNNDTEKQQELLASLPQPMEEDLTMSPAQEAESSVEMNSTQKDSSVSEGEGDGESM